MPKQATTGTMDKTSEALIQHEFLNRMETVMLMKDNNNYKDDVTITYNGVNYQIQRGKPVQVPMFLKLILEDSYRQQLAATEFSEALNRSFEEKTRRVESNMAIE